ncbi:bifunctional riboflavin kinase/FAD synthetase [Rhodopirellula sp. P2]|uniref:bifunctional riboflavin kinase/FAD synthetase n=1 Tax=Rhodopirellula sp. P2 TaxID=2127060 RepID=UPI00236848EE|nr:bifunctional riboflavin kinase/FAD synthetase [Rhodopirellula sp. P2]WDQ18307.1 bifunctional riboflavin kinase/FAD synthetase [Rhodopirellula sp. P2]
MTSLIHLSDLAGDPDLHQSLQGGAISIGNFDGVHLGHRALLDRVRQHAERVGGKAIAIVMDPHPASVLRPHGAPPKLTTLPRRAELMSELGIDHLLVCEATREFLNQTAEEFFQRLIVEQLSGKAIIEGPNFFFGRDRAGNTTRLKELAEERQIDVEIVVPSVRDERLVSSSRVREAIASGDIPLANQMLGSQYCLTGTVTTGEQRGRTLGFPTANLSGVETLIPEHGVYAAMACWEETDGRTRHPAAVHIGPNPTFDERQETKIEAHLLDYDGDLYGKVLTLTLVSQVRSVQKFASVSALKQQLQLDLQTVRETVSSLPSHS